MKYEPSVVFVVAEFQRATKKAKCADTFALNADRVEYFKTQLDQLDITAKDVVIVIINIDDPNGHSIAGTIKSEQYWQEIRDRGEIPFARGLAERAYIEKAIGCFDDEAATKLREMTEVAVVVIDHGVAEIFPA